MKSAPFNFIPQYMKFVYGRSTVKDRENKHCLQIYLVSVPLSINGIETWDWMLENDWNSFTRPVYTMSSAHKDRAINFCLFAHTVTIKRHVLKQCNKKKVLSSEIFFKNWLIWNKNFLIRNLCLTPKNADHIVYQNHTAPIINENALL